MSPCPSRLELSRWEVEPESERPVDVTAHLGSCGHCATVFADIARARSELLGADPETASRRAARNIRQTVRERQRRRRWVQILAPALLVPAAAALLFVVKPMLPSPGSKGELVVETYCRRGDKVFLAADGQDFLAGDRLRFAYTTARPGYLMVFGVDDRGRVFPYYEEGALRGIYAEAGARILLPGSVELDDHKGWERVYAVWSEAQLADDAVRTAVARGLSAAGNDIRRLTTLDLPVEQVSMLLGRP